MNEQLFDAMLRTALEEALEEDCREAPAEQKHTGHTSLRRMLADPWGYERRSRAAKQMEAQQKMQVKTPVRHLRWPVLAAAVLLLTVSVTGYALRGGAFFQSFFEIGIVHIFCFTLRGGKAQDDPVIIGMDTL